jgi:polysaccharide export outer membrane protein
MRSYVDDPYILAADLRSQHGTLSNESAREQARISRVLAELGRSVKLTDVPDVSLTAREVKGLEVEQLDTRKVNFEKERLYLTEVVRSLSANLNLLEKQLQTEEKRAEIDQDDLSRVEGLVSRGMAPVTRLSDTKRLVLLSASRATEIEARAEQVRQRRAEEERKLQKLYDDRKIELLQELQTAKITLAATESKLSAVTEKMFIVGAAQSQIGRGGPGAPELIVYRKAVSGEERLDATEETELRPGDVVEITVPLKDLAAGNAHQAYRATEQKRAQPNQVRTQ